MAFPNLQWPQMPPLNAPQWAWPEMPALRYPQLALGTLTLPHWGQSFKLCGFDFDGFSIKLRILISLFQVLCQLSLVYAIPWPPMFSALLSWVNFITWPSYALVWSLLYGAARACF